MDNFRPMWITKAREVGQSIMNMLGNERGEIIIPFMDTVPEGQADSIGGFVEGIGATTESLAAYKTYDEFVSGYKAPSPAAAAVPDNNKWKAGLGEDLSKSPTLEKFEDTPEGLVKATESYVSLEKLLGHDKVPIPKGADDIEGIKMFNKAMGIPETAEAYNLPDATIPEGAEGMSFDKKAFGEVVFELALTPAQATGLWGKYTEMSNSAYKGAIQASTDKLNESINSLRAEWGDSYAANVELGQLVINKFAADDKGMGDFLVASLSKDPAGMRFLAKVGTEFAENKVGDFQIQKFGMSPTEAVAEVAKIKGDSKHAYMNPNAPQAEHDAAVAYVDKLMLVANKKPA